MQINGTDNSLSITFHCTTYVLFRKKCPQSKIYKIGFLEIQKLHLDKSEEIMFLYRSSFALIQSKTSNKKPSINRRVFTERSNNEKYY